MPGVRRAAVGFVGFAAAALVPVEQCFDQVDAVAWGCCNTSHGPRGQVSCWDDEYTFERCCRELYEFDLKHCCGSSSKCTDFAFSCSSIGPCAVRPRRLQSMRQLLRTFGQNATRCDDGSPLLPPEYMAVTEKTGDTEHGLHLSLKGTLWLPTRGTTTVPGDLKHFVAPVEPCLGQFLQHQKVYGTCVQSHHTIPVGGVVGNDRCSSGAFLPAFKFFDRECHNVFSLSKPLRDLDCASLCNPKRCRILATEAALELDEKQLARNRLILAVPKACSNADVAFKVLPAVISQRVSSAFPLAEVELYHWLPGDPCEHRGRPGVVPFLATSLAMLAIPWLRPSRPADNGEHGHDGSHIPAPKRSIDALDVVNLLRVVALWNTCCLHWDIRFPFQSFCHWLNSFAPESTLVFARKQAALEGLYVMITVFLVLRLESWHAFCQRLLRKVGRQVVVNYFITSALPLLLHTSSPMNCLREPKFRSVSAISANFLFTGAYPNWNWATQMEMRIFLVIGSLGLLRSRLPQVSPAVCVAYWAYYWKLSQGEEELECGPSFRHSVHMTTSSSFLLHWLPISLILLNLDTCLRTPRAKFLMGRFKEFLGHFWGPLLLAVAFLSFLVSLSSRFDVYWRRLGFVTCPRYLGTPSGDPSMPYSLGGVPFHITVFVALHLAAVPSTRPQANWLRPLGAFSNAFRDINLAFNIWHLEVWHLCQAHFPAWISLKRLAEQNSLVAAQLLFFTPLGLVTFILAWLTYHLVEKPWARLFRMASVNCPKMLLYGLSGGYFVMNHVVYYANNFDYVLPPRGTQS